MLERLKKASESGGAAGHEIESRESKKELDDIEATIDNGEAGLGESRKTYDKVIDRVAGPACGGTGCMASKPDEPYSGCDDAMTRGRYDAKLKPEDF